MVGSGRVGSLRLPPAFSSQPWFTSHSGNRRPQWPCAAACPPGSHSGSTLPLTFESLGTSLCGNGVYLLDQANHSLILGLEVASSQGLLGREVEKDQVSGCLSSAHRCPSRESHSAVIFSQMGRIMTLFPQFYCCKDQMRLSNSGAEQCRRRASVAIAVTILICQKVFCFSQGKDKFCSFLVKQILHEIDFTEISSCCTSTSPCRET